MGLEHTVVDAWVKGLVDAHGDRLARDPSRRPSAAFALLCARTLLDLGDHDVLPYLTDGPDDCGVDVFFVHGRDEQNFTLPVTLFSAKYSQSENRERQAFPKNEIQKLIDLVRRAFDPRAVLPANPTLQALVEEVHGHLKEGYVPSIRVVACTMGQRWDASAQRDIEDAALPGVAWDLLLPDALMALRRGAKPVDAKLQLVGPVLREGFGFHQSLIGRMRAQDVAELITTHGDALIDRNVRRYLGTRNRVNREIVATLKNEREREHLFFLNNGLTFACTRIRHNQIQTMNHVVRADGLQLVNGAQTAYTLQHVLAELGDVGEASVLVRLYEIAEDEDPELIARITRATNSQSPVDLRDLHANDPIQRDLELALAERGWIYLRKRSANGGDPDRVLTPTEAAAAILAVIRRMPHLARFAGPQHFGSLYSKIFQADLTADKVIRAVELVRDSRAASRVRREDTDGQAAVRIAHYGRFHVALARAMAEDANETSTVAFHRVVLWLARRGVSLDSAAELSLAFQNSLVVDASVLRDEWLETQGRSPSTLYERTLHDLGEMAGIAGTPPDSRPSGATPGRDRAPG